MRGTSTIYSRSGPRRETGFARTCAPASEIDTLVHYPVPMPAQPAFASAEPEPCPMTERVCDELVSLPLYPGLADADINRVIDVVRNMSDLDPDAGA